MTSALKQSMGSADRKKTVEGTLTLASVGKEKLNDDECRWFELVTEANIPGSDKTNKTVIKALIAEKHLKNGESPIENWLMGYQKFGDRDPIPVTERHARNFRNAHQCDFGTAARCKTYRENND